MGDKYERNHSTDSTPISRSIRQIISWSTVSKAFWRSSIIIPVNIPLEIKKRRCEHLIFEQKSRSSEVLASVRLKDRGADPGFLVRGAGILNDLLGVQGPLGPLVLREPRFSENLWFPNENHGYGKQFDA
ncbi:hypothetical protein DPMN_013539 [Dreissena polymorpha]|uniref:Uncharacterized protein n=1 Tax=Dreissena polymorpha TaxID=45954 RepID=A0A9D4NA15_DREPO|nr:hypothetical protein DPMN_013539 [Dreissena polymorpha]